MAYLTYTPALTSSVNTASKRSPVKIRELFRAQQKPVKSLPRTLVPIERESPSEGLPEAAMEAFESKDWRALTDLLEIPLTGDNIKVFETAWAKSYALKEREEEIIEDTPDELQEIDMSLELRETELLPRVQPVRHVRKSLDARLPRI